jgi:tRNA (guanine37-N1)-methyltransferase
LLSPQGETFSQKKAGKLSKLEHIILLAGHYEGFDERINEHLVDEELSIGNYVLTGGELPAMVITDAIVRLLPGLLSEEAREQESFSQMKNVFDYPVYTRPEEFNGWKVPEILLTGDHKKINAWREGVALEKTKSRKR